MPGSHFEGAAAKRLRGQGVRAPTDLDPFSEDLQIVFVGIDP